MSDDLRMATNDRLGGPAIFRPSIAYAWRGRQPSASRRFHRGRGGEGTTARAVNARGRREGTEGARVPGCPEAPVQAHLNRCQAPKCRSSAPLCPAVTARRPERTRPLAARGQSQLMGWQRRNDETSDTGEFS